jgi:NADP-dependent aldehyde dehydrogenase
MPKGVFALLHGNSHRVGQALTKHPLTKAVAFTGSLGGGRALFDAASSRAEPIPVYAEMSSLNPVIVLPGALAERAEAIADQFLASVTLGVGQFCTKPGLVFGLESAPFSKFAAAAGQAARQFVPQTMLNPPMLETYNQGLERLATTQGVKKAGESSQTADAAMSQAKAAVFTTDSRTYRAHQHLQEENFGPSAVVIACADRAELMRQVRDLDGHLAASVHGTDADLAEYADVISLLETKVGRIVINGFTTGIDLCHSMVHGGPYPATTYSGFPSLRAPGMLPRLSRCAFASCPEGRKQPWHLAHDRRPAHQGLAVIRV